VSIIAFSGAHYGNHQAEQETSQSRPGFFIYKPPCHPGKPHLARPVAKSYETTMINGYSSLFLSTSSTFISLNRFTGVEIYYTANEEKFHQLLNI
jgi:hypothetical protein